MIFLSFFALFPHSPKMSSFSNHHSAIHCQHLSGNEVGCGTGQEEDSLRYILRPTDPPQRSLFCQSLHILGREVGVHIGIDHTWSHAVDPNMRGAKFLGHGTGQADHPCLGGGICRLTGAAGKAPHRRYGNNASLLTTHHPGDGRTHSIHHAVQIGPGRPAPLLIGQVGQQSLDSGHPSVTNQRIQSSKLPLGLFHQRRGLLGLGHIPLQRCGPDAQLLQFLYQLQGLLPGTAVINSYIPARLSKPPGAGRANSPGRSSDQHRRPSLLLHTSSSFSFSAHILIILPLPCNPFLPIPLFLPLYIYFIKILHFLLAFFRPPSIIFSIELNFFGLSSRFISFFEVCIL